MYSGNITFNMRQEAKNFVTHFIEIIILLQQSGIKPTISPRYACIATSTFKIPFACYIFLLFLHLYSVCASFDLKQVSFRQHIDGPCYFIHSATLSYNWRIQCIYIRSMSYILIAILLIDLQIFCNFFVPFSFCSLCDLKVFPSGMLRFLFNLLCICYRFMSQASTVCEL